MANRRDLATALGAIVQGVVLGALLVLAFLELIGRLGGTEIFRYQGF